MQIEISVVIPTFNRPESLRRLLSSLEIQKFTPKEVIIVDASDETIRIEGIQLLFPTLNISHIITIPSVCKQRNIGIRMSKSNYVFLCDDDIEVSADYLFRVVTYLLENPAAGIVTGWVLDKKAEGWNHQYDQTSFLGFVWNFIFQLTVWTDLSKVKSNLFTRPIIHLLQIFYANRGNTFTLAGWPLITSFKGEVIQTTFYTLSACIANKEWVMDVPFDEKLSANGIGENYGITALLPYKQPIHILNGVFVYHHHELANRLKLVASYQLRIFALHYFMTKSYRFNRGNIVFLYWSLLGNLIWQLCKLKMEMARATLKTITMLLLGRNPYK